MCAQIAFDLPRMSGQLEIRLHIDHHLRGLRNHEVHAAIGGQQGFDQAQTVLDAGGAGERDGNR